MFCKEGALYNSSICKLGIRSMIWKSAENVFFTSFVSKLVSTTKPDFPTFKEYGQMAIWLEPCDVA